MVGCTVGGSDRSSFGDGEGGDATATDGPVDTDAPMTSGPDGDGTGEAEGDSTGEPSMPDGPPVDEYIEEARTNFPTYLDLHEKVITRTCSPNGGVCHNEKEYPDLHTPDTMLSQLDVPCNLAETDPLNLFNGCEPGGDRLRFTTGNNTTFSSTVATSSRTTTSSAQSPASSSISPIRSRTRWRCPARSRAS